MDGLFTAEVFHRLKVPWQQEEEGNLPQALPINLLPLQKINN
jgi:hypothetical protein